jgi:hypothetical protein
MAESISNQHLTDDAIELYALGRLPADQLETFEKHLFYCHHCQDRLREADEYVHAAKEGTERFTSTAAARPRFWHNLFEHRGPALALAAVLVLAVVIPLTRLTRDLPAQTVELAAVRGGSATVATAGAPLELRLSAEGLDLQENVSVEVVDARGNASWSGEGKFEKGRWTVPVDRRLGAGTYWVRLYARGSTDLLREYHLRVE